MDTYFALVLFLHYFMCPLHTYAKIIIKNVRKPTIDMYYEVITRISLVFIDLALKGYCTAVYKPTRTKSDQQRIRDTSKNLQIAFLLLYVYTGCFSVSKQNVNTLNSILISKLKNFAVCI